MFWGRFSNKVWKELVYHNDAIFMKKLFDIQSVTISALTHANIELE